MFDERETPIEEEKYFIARIYVPLSIESLGVHKFRISEKIRINPMFHELESPIRLLNNNIHGLSPSVGHHSLLFDQGFPNNARIQRHLADWWAIWQYFFFAVLWIIRNMQILWKRLLLSCRIESAKMIFYWKVTARCKMFTFLCFVKHFNSSFHAQNIY